MNIKFFSYLDSLRHKSIEERRKATFTITVLIVVVILMLALFVGYVRTLLVERVIDDGGKSPRVINGIEAPY